MRDYTVSIPGEEPKFSPLKPATKTYYVLSDSIRIELSQRDIDYPRQMEATIFSRIGQELEDLKKQISELTNQIKILERM